MGKTKTIVSVLMALLLFMSCSFAKYEESGSVIVSAEKSADLLEKQGFVLVDAQKKTSWKKEHVKGAVNIERNEIVVKTPVPNSLAPAQQISDVAGRAGLTESSDILIYDDNKNMDSGRLFWSLRIYGHKGDIKIVSGGLQALKAAGYDIVDGEESATAASYKAGSLNDGMIADKAAVMAAIDEPPADYALIDVRTDEEYEAGTIPGSVHINFAGNNFSDGTYKGVQHIRIQYKEQGVMPSDEVVMFCKSSVRAAQTYVALYNAGYRNLKVYDGAWLQWSKDKMPVYKPETNKPEIAVDQDNS